MGEFILNGRNYGGSIITPNPSDTPTDSLDSIKIDDTTYEVQGGGGGGSSLIIDAQRYSLEEQVVGIWTDGKPIYQKTMTISVNNVADWTLVDDTVSYDWLVYNNGIIYIDIASKDLISHASTRNGVPRLAVRANHKLYYYADNLDTGYSWKYQFTIQYTKTTDTAGSGDYQAYGFSPIIYSDTEREVGVWRDNKPLYQKTVAFGNLSSGTQTISMGLSNTETVIKLDINAQVPSGAWLTLPMTYINTNLISQYGAVSDGYNASTDKVTINVGSSRSFTRGYITILYTKTTDVAGSGEYNTLAIPNVHYSTNEQVIGTWIDGKTLYQKTVTVQNNVAWSDNATFDNTISDADTIWIYDGYIYDGRSAANIIYPNPIIQPTDRGGFTIDISDKTKFKFKSSTTFSVNSSRYAVLTVRYTKTTD